MEKAISEIEGRFQILITLSVFFPVLLYNLSKLSSSTEADALTMSLRISALIGCTLVDYIIFESRKNDFALKSIKRISTILLWAIGFFIIPIFGLGILTFSLPKWAGGFVAVLSGASVLFVLTVPVFIEFILLIFSIITDFKKK